MKKHFPCGLSFTALAVMPLAAMATNGYFPHGYGMKAQGMGGTAVASTDNAFAGANNPAVAAFAGNRMEGGVGLFMPHRRCAAQRRHARWRGQQRPNGLPRT